MEIFDAYVEDIAEQEKAKEKKSTKAGAGKEEGKQKKVHAMDLQVHLCIYIKIQLKHLHVKWLHAWTGYYQIHMHIFWIFLVEKNWYYFDVL